MPKKFKKRKEDFTCEQCGKAVQGTGYTNHCPECFTSKHVDINPGDRAATCGGLMKVVEVDSTKDKWRVQHECERCQFQRWQTVGAKDNMDTLIELQRIISEKKFSQL